MFELAHEGSVITSGLGIEGFQAFIVKHPLRHLAAGDQLSNGVGDNYYNGGAPIRGVGGHLTLLKLTPQRLCALIADNAMTMGNLCAGAFLHKNGDGEPIGQSRVHAGLRPGRTWITEHMWIGGAVLHKIAHERRVVTLTLCGENTPAFFIALSVGERACGD
jgi:hypothetical protein